MHTIYHYPLCPFSRSVRLMAGEYGIEFDWIEEKAWDRRQDFLRLNPAGNLPVLATETGAAICGNTIIFEYVEEAGLPPSISNSLMPEDPVARAEMRRIIAWFDQKFNDEVTRNLVVEKVDRRFAPKEFGGGPPDGNAVRAGLANIRYHLQYIGFLAARSNWLCGDAITYADLCAAAHLSCVDFLGDVPWSENIDAKNWYARIKSRPSFRPFFADTIRGMTAPDSYADLDF